jgi:hypothetical protein
VDHGVEKSTNVDCDGLSTAYQKNGHSIRPLISMLKAADL